MKNDKRIEDLAYGYLISGVKWPVWERANERDRSEAKAIIERLAGEIRPLAAEDVLPVKMWNNPIVRLGQWR